MKECMRACQLWFVQGETFTTRWSVKRRHPCQTRSSHLIFLARCDCFLSATADTRKKNSHSYYHMIRHISRADGAHALQIRSRVFVSSARASCDSLFPACTYMQYITGLYQTRIHLTGLNPTS